MKKNILSIIILILMLTIILSDKYKTGNYPYLLMILTVILFGLTFINQKKNK